MSTVIKSSKLTFAKSAWATVEHMYFERNMGVFDYCAFIVHDVYSSIMLN